MPKRPHDLSIGHKLWLNRPRGDHWYIMFEDKKNIEFGTYYIYVLLTMRSSPIKHHNLCFKSIALGIIG